MNQEKSTMEIVSIYLLLLLPLSFCLFSLLILHVFKNIIWSHFLWNIHTVGRVCVGIFQYVCKFRLNTMLKLRAAHTNWAKKPHRRDERWCLVHKLVANHLLFVFFWVSAVLNRVRVFYFCYFLLCICFTVVVSLPLSSSFYIYIVHWLSVVW